MRRRAGLIIGVLALSSGGSAAPAVAADLTVLGIDEGTNGGRWDNPNPTIEIGDTVTWSFTGTKQVHNVASDSPNWGYSSPLESGRIPARDGRYRFDAAGAFKFVCEVHPEMKGTVTVTERGAPPPLPPPPPGPGETLYPNDDPLIPVPLIGGLDTTRPTLTRLRVRLAGSRVRASLRVDERCVVDVRVRRAKKTVTNAQLAGDKALQRTLRLRPGRYTVEVRATDLAGNRSRWQTKRITVR